MKFINFQPLYVVLFYYIFKLNLNMRIYIKKNLFLLLVIYINYKILNYLMKNNFMILLIMI